MIVFLRNTLDASYTTYPEKVEPLSATSPQRAKNFARRGLCPRAAIKCVHIIRRPPPGSGCRLLKGSKESLSTRLTRLTRMAGRWKGVLGA